MVDDGVTVDLADAALPGSQRTGEVTPVVDGEGQVGGRRLADGLAVLPALGDREHLEVQLDAVRNLVQCWPAGVEPHARFAPCAASRALSMSSAVPRGDLGEGLAIDRGEVLEVLTLRRRHPFAADEDGVPALNAAGLSALPGAE